MTFKEGKAPHLDMADFSSYQEVLPLGQQIEGKRIFVEKVQQTQEITIETFEQRVRDVAWLIEELKNIDPLTENERELFAHNIRISLENFITEEILEHGTNAEKLKEEILEEYRKTLEDHNISINIHFKSLLGVIQDEKIKTFSEIDGIRREGRGITGTESQYTHRRDQRDHALGYNQKFIVGALSTHNGYDENIGPAPFYGHGVISLKGENISSRTSYYEGDSMTNEKTASKVVPRWLMRKWEQTESRKLDEQGAVLSKALMEISTRKRGFTHIHLLYVEAHIAGEVQLEDIDGITYALGLQEYRKSDLKEKIQAGSKEPYSSYLKDIEQKEEERNRVLQEIDRIIEQKRLKLKMQRIEFIKEINPKEAQFYPGKQKLALTSDQLF